MGQILASHGPSESSLDAVLGVLADSMGYRNLVLLIAQGDRLRIGASRGYESFPASLSIDAGIVGRTYRTGEAAWVKMSATTPTTSWRTRRYAARSPFRCVPHGQVIGVLDIEAARRRAADS